MLGGGPVGSELAQAWSTLGTEVDAGRGRASGCSPARSPSPASRWPTSLREQHGVDVRTGVAGRAGRRRAAPASTVELDDGDAARGGGAPGRGRPQAAHRRASASTRSGSSPARAASSRPTTGSGSAAATGSTRSATSTAGRSSPTWASTRRWVAAENVLGRDGRGDRRRDRLAPRHLHRPAGRRGRQDPRAGPGGRDRRDARSTSPPTAPPAPASTARAPAARRRIVVDEAARTIVGATFTGFETADFLHAATIAVVGEVPLDRLRHAVAAYPTRSEIWLKLLEAYGL